jgi:hypothetical protein
MMPSLESHRRWSAWHWGTVGACSICPASNDSVCSIRIGKWHASTSGISEYVLFNPRRPRTHIHSVKTAWHNALKLAGIARFPIYQCRHSFATRLAGLGVSDTIIDQLLGHSRRDVLRFYTARVPEYLRDAVNLLEKMRTAKTEPTIGSRNRRDRGAPRRFNPNKLG